jgi:hypothetical protein
MSDLLLLETGDVLLLETGDAFLAEDGSLPPAADRTADVWFEFVHAKFPATEGTTTRRWSKQPYADEGAFKEGRLISTGPISRSASDINGNYQVGTASVILDDSDNFIRGLLEQGTVTEYFLNREAGIYQLTPEGRAAGLDPRPLFRGWISNVQTLRGHRVKIEIADVVGSQFSKFNLDKTIPSVKLIDLNADIIDALKEKVLPIYVGEHSDFGAEDVNGNPAEKGLVPCFDLGLVDATDPETPPAPTYATPPTISSATVVGSGDQDYSYAVVLVTPYGESLPSAVTNVSSAPATAVMDTSNYVELSGTYDPGALGTNGVRILGRHGTSTWLDEAFLDPDYGEWYYNDGAHPAPTPTRIDVDIEKTYAGPTTPAIESDTIWNIMAICLGYSYDILQIYGSDLAEGTEPKRTNLASVYGTEILTPSDAGWPFANPWIELNGITFTGFLARGNRLRHHQEGVVTFAANICGPHDGTSPDKVINQAFYQLLFVLNEHVAKNGGTGYRTGDYWPLETYVNGDSIFDTDKFTEKQELTATWLGDSLGYLGAIPLTEPITVREFVRRFNLTFGCRLAHNHHGQIFPVLVAPADDPTAGRHLRYPIEINDIGEPVLAHDEIMNRVTRAYHWDPDAGAFRNSGVTTEDATSIAAHTPGGVVGGTDRRGVKQGDDRDMYYTNDEATADDVITRELARRARRPRYVPVVVDYLGLEYDIDTQVRITIDEGLGTSGDAAAPCLVLAHETAPDLDVVTLTVQDLRSLDA